MMKRVSVLLLAAFALSACYPSFHDLGYPQPLTPPQLETRSPAFIQPPRPEIIYAEERASMSSTSLWSAQRGQLFRDNRAFEEGDILTVRIAMNDFAELQNVSERETKAAGGITAAGTFKWDQLNPESSLDASLSLNGNAERGGSVNRAEQIRLSLAAVVVRASPNGNLVVAGTQEVRVNHEMRLLTVEGVVRASDILPDNSIPFEKIAEARISYGGGNTRPRHRPWFKAPHPGLWRPEPVPVAYQSNARPGTVYK